jgi:cysteine synthase
MVGPSAGAIIAGALAYLGDEALSGLAVAVAPDSGQKAASYLAQILE